VSVSTDAGLCTAVVVLPMSTITDNCGVTDVDTVGALSAYPVGVTTVGYTAYDASGNSATCTFEVVVSDTESPLVLCPSSVSVSTDTGSCTAVVVLPMATITDNCGVTDVVTVGALSAYPVGVTTVGYTAYDASGNSASCTFEVVVSDGNRPVLTCPETATFYTLPNVCYSGILVIVDAVDNCTNVTISNDAPPFQFVGQVMVTYIATNENGNTDTCVVQVTVLDTVPPSLVCPPNLTVAADNACQAVGVSLGTVQTGDNCGIQSNTNDAPSAFSLGLTQVVHTVSDLSGNTNSCVQLVTVEDRQPPVLVCPANITTVTDLGSCFATGVNLGQAQFSDNCPDVLLSLDTLSAYPLGATTILYTAADPSGNSSTCVQTLQVIDNPATIWYLDADEDGYYTGQGIAQCASPGAGYRFDGILGGDDCDDINPLLNPATIWYLDADGDGFTTGPGVVSCTSPGPGYIYTGILGDNDCNDNDPLTIAPIAVISGQTSACDGGVVTLFGSGGISFAWSTGVTGASIQVSTSGTYSLTVTDQTGCTDDEQVTVVIFDVPVVGITGQTTICLEDTAVLTGTGGVTYLWSTGDTTASVALSPMATSMYTVTATDANGCTGTATATVVVNPLPDAAITGPSRFCLGDTVQLTASGGVAYLWSTQSTDAAISISPTVSTSYSVTVTDGFGCTAVAEKTLMVDTLPIAVISGQSSACDGELVTLIGSGGISFAWSTGATGESIQVSTSGTYSLTVTDQLGCMGMEQVAVVIFDLPVVGITGQTTICLEDTAVLTGTGGVTYLWSTGDTTASVALSPMATSMYTVTATDANGCTGTATATVVVNPLPDAAITGPSRFCIGDTVQLTASGGVAYLWNTQSTDAGISVSPAVSTSYSVTVTDGFGCSVVAEKTVMVDTLPVAMINGSLKLCEGSTTVLTASGGVTYLWSSGTTASSDTLSAPGTYSVTATDGNGCTGSASAVVEEVIITLTTATTDETCVGDNDGTATLTVSGGDAPFTYSWSSGASTKDLLQTASGTYMVTATDANGCSKTAEAIVCLDCKAFAGLVRYMTDTSSRISDVVMTLGGAGSDIMTTDTDGSFLLTAPAGNVFTIQGAKTSPRIQGVNAADFTRIQRHITALEPFQTGYEVLAADANGDQKISNLDVIVGAQCLLGNQTACNRWNVPVWRFVPAGYVFPNINAPWNAPSTYTSPDMSNSCLIVDGVDFVGLKSLDVVTPYAFERPVPVVLRGPDMTLQAGQQIEVPIQAEGYTDVIAFQFALGFNPAYLKLLSVESADTGLLNTGNFGLWHAEEGQFRVLQYGTTGTTRSSGSTLFTARFVALQGGEALKDVLYIDETPFAAEAYSAEGFSPRPFELSLERTTSTGGPAPAESLALTAQPNPASGSTLLRYHLPLEGEARIRLMDATGRLISEHNAAHSAGDHVLRVELPMAGLYMAELRTAYGVVGLKLVGQ
jgi:hypothetical protein